MTNDEASSLGLPVVDTYNEPGFNPANGGPYFFPNNFSSVAAATGGQWWPILKPCETLTQATLDQACDEHDNGNTDAIASPGANQIPDTEWDDRGRLLCRPGGASVQEQLEDLIERIMTDSPIITVQ